MRSTLRVCVLGGLALVGGAAVASATVFLPADLTVLVRDSHAIVHGRVIDVRPTWMDGRRRIDSFVTVEVFEYFKGALGETVTFRTPGGQIGRYRSVTVGAPVFEAGDEVVLFLGAQGPSVPYVLGMSQGVFRVVPGPTATDKLVTPPVVLAEGATEPVRRGATSRRPLALQAFEDTVRGVLARAGGAE